MTLPTDDAGNAILDGQHARKLLQIIVEYYMLCPPDIQVCFNRAGEGPVRCVRCWERWADRQVAEQ